MSGPQRATTEDGQRLARFLMGDDRAHPSVAALRAAGVSGRAYVRSADHPERDALRADFTKITARHLAVRHALDGLVAAWNDGGVEALVFKGFYLAEFVYGTAAERPYHDVDLLIPPAHVEAACEVARSTGWRLDWRLGEEDHPTARRASGYDGHEAAILVSPSRTVHLDIHRRIAHNTHNRLPYAKAQRRLTEAAWSASRTATLGQATVRVLDPRDAVVIGLAVNRSWGSDAWSLKPRDFADFAALAQRFDLDLGALRARASELGVATTFDLFLERCEPFAGRFRLGEPTWWQRRTWNLQVARERGWSDGERWAMDGAQWVADGLAVARVLPLVRRAVRHVERGASPMAWTTTTRTGSPPRLTSRSWFSLRRAIHRASRLFGVPEASRRTVAALVALAALRRRGHPARIEATDGALFVSLDGRLLDPIADEQAERDEAREGGAPNGPSTGSRPNHPSERPDRKP